MNVNIVTVNTGWILQKIAERTAKYNTDKSVTFTVSHRPDPNADVNYYVDLQNCFGGQQTKCDIAYFTHADENSPRWLTNVLINQNGYQLDGIISMNRRYTDMLIDVGYPAHRVTTITPGETRDAFKIKKITVGVVSRGGWPGYGQQFMEEFFTKYDCKNFKFRFLGSGWNGLYPIVSQKNIDVEFQDDIDYSIYPDFYHSLDYLLIPGLWTAGPMSMQEALSCGIPIIGADVGFVNYEFQADYSFTPGSVLELSNIFDDIQRPILQRRSQVENMSWSNYAKDVVSFITKIKSLP
jgi:glycosyltransferase involved in cell wall biosynthesis